ncbi:hypothetical protein THASP1DRAFT_26329 [Thamnocephalis sphaerospora]|uniref:GPI anchored protein n=1 Tax=Thamnocephalis sphaerospora TaxID=78915 RepID=A0A4P9XHG5_9FUNG|nr:hypothetical protein THASP1DRAFT_26329 [Thamnocephalis sphaerospora]|eukprot:RKP05123.1 hypothetical protein THASP1DRAFT_26329 [Thamnocephalis sphaerospora]
MHTRTLFTFALAAVMVTAAQALPQRGLSAVQPLDDPLLDDLPLQSHTAMRFDDDHNDDDRHDDVDHDEHDNPPVKAAGLLSFFRKKPETPESISLTTMPEMATAAEAISPMKTEAPVSEPTEAATMTTLTTTAASSTPTVTPITTTIAATSTTPSTTFSSQPTAGTARATQPHYDSRELALYSDATMHHGSSVLALVAGFMATIYIL